MITNWSLFSFKTLPSLSIKFRMYKSHENHGRALERKYIWWEMECIYGVCIYPIPELGNKVSRIYRGCAFREGAFREGWLYNRTSERLFVLTSLKLLLQLVMFTHVPLVQIFDQIAYYSDSIMNNINIRGFLIHK